MIRLFVIGFVFVHLIGCALFTENVDKPGETLTHSRKKILVFPFRNASGLGGDALAEHATVAAKDAVLRCDGCQLVSEEETKELELQAKDLGITLADSYDERRLLPWARSRGIVGLLSGTIEDIRAEEDTEDVGLFRSRKDKVRARVVVDLFDVENDKRVIEETALAETSEEYSEALSGFTPEREADHARAAVEKAVEAGLKQLPGQLRRLAWVGRISKADGSRFFINAGEESGLKKGQLLKVFAEGTAVNDSKSGQYLGTAPGRLKGLLKIVDHFGTDGSVAVVHSGAGFREQDRVEVFAPPK